MARTRIIALLAYDGFQLLDITGPAAVFAAAGRALGRKTYEVTVLSPRGGATPSDIGVVIATLALARMPPERVDYTVAVAEVLARLLPAGVPGSISTVPGSYRVWIKSAEDEHQVLAGLARS